MKLNVVFASRDPNRAGVILEALQASGMSVSVVQKAKDVTAVLVQRHCDLLLVGQRLMDEDGLSLVRNLRARGPARQMPIVAVVEHGEAPAFPERQSAVSAAGEGARKNPFAGVGHSPSPTVSVDSKMSLRVAFFQAGADECLSLNWDVAECLARIRAVLRRIQVSPTEEVIKMGEIELNLTSYTLHVAGKKVNLTSKELDLLYVFLNSANRVLSRPYLIERVWGYNYFGSPRTVDVHVRRLREKLGSAARFITTIPCVGYKLVPPGSDSRR